MKQTKFFSLVTLLVGSLLGSMTFAAPMSVEYPDVSSLCSSLECTAPMRSILDDYLKSADFFATEELPFFASGGCYHLNPGLNGNIEHHGLFVFETNLGQPQFTGVFSFFGSGNPYQGLNLEQAKLYVLDRGSVDHPLEIVDHQGRGVLRGDTSNLFYWFRANRSTREVYLLSAWVFQGGTGNEIYCRLKY